MSYYSSKHPGLYLYLVLITVTLSAFLFWDIGSAQIGLLSVLWGLFTATRALSLYEINAYYNTYTRQSTIISKEHNAQSSALAHDLMRRMTSGINMKQGIRALYCMHERTILWFALALGYTAYTLHVSAPMMSRNALMEVICTLFMIGAAFWGGQSYAHDNKAYKLMLLVFTTAFGISLYYLSANIITADLPQALSALSMANGVTPQTFLILLAIYSGVIMIYALLQRNKATLSAIAGITLIALLVICHVSLEPSQATTALWISGWGLFSLFWTRAFQPISRRYVLYQSD
jgi:hypothetical protein